MGRRLLSRVWLLPALLLLWAEPAAACLCRPSPSACDGLANATDVFVGTVTASESAPKPKGKGGRGWLAAERAYTFAVEESFRGAKGDRIKVLTGMGGGDCGYVFVVGMRYLVYAHAAAPGDPPRTGLCSRTMPAAAAAADIEVLRGLALAPGVTVRGEVRRVRHSVSADGTKMVSDEGPVPGATVFITDGRRPVRARTDAEGKFSVSGLAHGTIYARAKPPDGLRGEPKEQVMKAEEGGCAHFRFEVSAEDTDGKSP